MKLTVLLVVAVAIIDLSTAALLGGFRPIDNDDAQVVSAAGHAANIMSDNTDGQIDLEVTSAQYKIIAGITFQLNVVVTIGNQKENCEIIVTERADLGGKWFVDSNNPKEICYSLIKEPNSPSVVKNRKRRSDRLFGGKEELDLNEQSVQEAANWAIDHINGRSNSLYRQVLERIADGSRQVVNGYKYRFLLYLVSSTCRNNGKHSGAGLDECPPGDQPMRQQCDASVLYSGGSYSMLKFKCKPLKAENMIGGDDHDYVPHGKVRKLLGGDDHDYKSHGKVINLIGGGDDHDYVPHGEVNNLIGGGDDHDYVPHGEVNNLIGGGDDHDYVPHGEVNNLIGGGDDHDYLPHDKIKNLLGGDDHDYMPHDKIKNLLGGDEHDYMPHDKIKNLLGGDDHDYIPHLKSKLNGLMNAAGKETKKQILNIGKDVLHHGVDTIEKMNILGGDTHDYQRHGNDPCQEYRAAFEQFKSEHKRLYASEHEENEKFQIFCGNMERVKEYQMMEQGSAVYGATPFADMSESEFEDKYLGLKMSGGWTPKHMKSAEIPKTPIPDSWDWREHNAVTPVKNQGSCGSCWAFSTTGNLEGRMAIKHKKLISLSEQELLDCDKVDEACNGGLPSQAYEAIMELGGIETEKDYGYEAAKEKCQFKKSEVAVKVTGALNISSDEADMAAWLYHNGPISIGINAFAMQFYMGGIAHPWKIFCNPKSLDHGVLIVGYGSDGGEPYWIVKNSWGPGWGREGYYYVYRGAGVCGLNTMCTSAIVE